MDFESNKLYKQLKMGNRNSLVLNEFNQQIEKFEGYEPIVLADLSSEYIEKIFQHFHENNKHQIFKIMVLGKLGSGKTHIIKSILKNIDHLKTNSSHGHEFGHETTFPTEFKLIKDDLELSFIEINGYGKGIEYLNYKDEIKTLICIHRPSVIWYVRSSEDYRMSENEMNEFSVFKELKVNVIFIANQIEQNRNEEIVNQWKKIVQLEIKTIRRVDQFGDENSDIKNLIDATLNQTTDMHEMISNDYKIELAKKRVIFYSIKASSISLLPYVDIPVIIELHLKMVYELCGLFGFRINATMAKCILKSFTSRMINYAVLGLVFDILTSTGLSLNAATTFGLTVKLGLTLIGNVESCIENNIDLNQMSEDDFENKCQIKFVDKLNEIDRLPIDEIKKRLGLNENECLLCRENRADVENLSCKHRTFCKVCVGKFFEFNHNKCGRCQKILEVNEMRQKYLN